MRRISLSAKTDDSTGFGTNSKLYGGRLLNHDGRPNIRRTGIKLLDGLSWYHTLIEMPRWKFILVIFGYFLAINLIFAAVYFMIGVEHLGGVAAARGLEKFIEAYFFSAQTFTTVGYGRINPTGYLTSFVAALEAFTGLLFFAIATGLFYARFSRPRAFIQFSDVALVAPYRGGTGFMCRMAPFKNNYLTDAEVKITLAMSLNENGREVNRFYPLDLEIAKINALSLSWTLVHPISENSPMFNLSSEDLQSLKAEILVFVKAFDETFSNTVVARASYISHEIVFGGKFLPMYHRSEDGETTVLEIDKLSSFEKVELNPAGANSGS